VNSKPDQSVRRAARKPPLEVARTVLGKSLPVSVRHAVQNYRNIAFADPPSDAKEFQQHQTACKSALQHIETLLKLAAAVETPESASAATDADTSSLLARAEAAVDAYANPESANRENGE